MRPAAESSTGYLRMKSANEGDSYLPMITSGNEYLSPQSHRDVDDSDDNDDDLNAVKTLQPAAVPDYANDTSMLSSTQYSAEKPLLKPDNQSVPPVKYSALKQYDQYV